MKHHFLLLAGLILSWYFSCKPEPVPGPVTPPSGNLVIEATVPAKVWDNVAQIYLDARRTGTMNGKRELVYQWTLKKTPAGTSLNMLQDADKPLATLSNPWVIGSYEIELLVADKNNPGTQTTAAYALEVLPDTLILYPPRSDAGADLTIVSPESVADLNGTGTFFLNPIGRQYRYIWSTVSQPTFSPVVEFLNPNSLITQVWGMGEGIYLFRLEVIDELNRTGVDTIQVTVLPDPLKGTVKVFDDLEWQIVTVAGDWDYYDEVRLDLMDPILTSKRIPANTEVRVWIDSAQTWTAPNAYEWIVITDGTMQVKYPFSNDEKVYLIDVGKKTRVEVRFK